MKKKLDKFLLSHRLFLIVVTFALFKPTSSTPSPHIDATTKDGFINSTLVISDSSMAINQLLKTHKSEMKEMMKKVNRLETNVQDLNDRVGRQENEIGILKSIVSHHKKRERREISSLPPCRKGLACAFDTEGTASEANKKPVNCDDLKSLGHTLNGFYLVQGNQDTIPLKSRVETIYCDFYKRPSPGNQTTGTTTESIGYIGTRPSIRGVHFYVQRSTSLSGKDVDINFQVERLNEGGAMDLTTGVFTAPIAGIYFFSFSAVKGKSGIFGTEIYLYHNAEFIGVAYGKGDRATLSLQSILELKKGDKIHLVKGKGDDLYASPETIVTMTTHFTGGLLDSGF